MKVQDVDMSKESVQIQEFTENVRSLLNSGGLEFEVTFAASPGIAPNETKLVLSLYGGTYRLYISYLGSWYYTGMTKL
jgi:uncharacterized protein YfaP (DUF2135 family)